MRVRVCVFVCVRVCVQRARESEREREREWCVRTRARARVRLRVFMCKDVGTELMHVMALSKACSAAVSLQGSRQTLPHQEGFRSVAVAVAVAASVCTRARARARLRGVLRAVEATATWRAACCEPHMLDTARH